MHSLLLGTLIPWSFWPCNSLQWAAHCLVGLVWYRLCFPRQLHLLPRHIEVLGYNACVCACVLSHFSSQQLCVTPRTIDHWDSLSIDLPAKKTGVGGHALLQGYNASDFFQLLDQAMSCFSSGLCTSHSLLSGQILQIPYVCVKCLSLYSRYQQVHWMVL